VLTPSALAASPLPIKRPATCEGYGGLFGLVISCDSSDLAISLVADVSFSLCFAAVAESDRPEAKSAALWRAFVEVLSGNPDMIQSLMAAHLPDPAGRCRGCTVSGTGTPDLRWPCPLWLTADAARQLLVRNRTAGAP
jgi:hypothetical protein